MSLKRLIDKNGFLKGLNPKKNPTDLFITLVGISAAIYVVISLILGKNGFANLFFIKCDDFYMDFFNSVRDASHGMGAYTLRKVIYPPMANLIYLLFSFITPDSYNYTAFDSRYNWHELPTCIAVAAVTALVCALLYFLLVYLKTKQFEKKKRLVFSFLAVFSVPMLFMLERGNILILALLSLMIYAFTYNSESKFKREIGLICLAFAFSIKLYPVVFGWFLVADKRFKEAIRCAVYGLILLIAPSFFFGGPICFYYIFENIVSFSSGSSSVISVIMNYIKLPPVAQKITMVAIYLWVLVCGVCFAISPFIRRDKPFKTWVLGFVTILCIPSLTAVYNWAFMIIPVIILCGLGENCKGRDMAYFVMLCIPFVFIPFRFSYHVTPNIVMIYLASAALSVFCVKDLVDDLSALIKKRKEEKISQ